MRLRPPDGVPEPKEKSLHGLQRALGEPWAARGHHPGLGPQNAPQRAEQTTENKLEHLHEKSPEVTAVSKVSPEGN